MLYPVLNPEERFDIWQGYREAISKLFNTVDDDLCYRFAPYGKLEDGDAPNVKELRDALEKVYDFVIAHHKQLDHEYTVFDTERTNAYNCFEAWCYGLCPKVLREFRLLWSFDYQDIAKFKLSEGISQEDTRQAVELWQKRNTLQAI